MTDVAVFRGTAAGVAAAVAAHEAGARVALVEPTPHIGGMVSGGLSWTDVGDASVLRGFAQRFYDEATYFPEPHVAERILVQFLEGIDVVDELPEAAVYVDASYEGDLLAQRGIPFAVGRESRELYGERWAGRQPAYRPSKHNFDVLLSPFRDDGSLLPHVLDDPEERLGEGDGALMAYQFRVCLTTRDPMPFEEPDGYDPAEFELLDRYLAAKPGAQLMGLVRDLLPNGKCDVNSIGPFSLNVLDGSNREYLDGNRDAVREHHLDYTKRFLFHVAPEGWGLCEDEFTDTGGWPHQLYVREGRRMLGAYVLTEHDLVETRAHDDAIAFGSYNIDIREVARTWRMLPEYAPTPAVFNEGYLSVPVPPYPIPYRCITPKREDATDLLVPVALSASHVAYSSVRMEPTWMMLGEAAGAAAAQAARRGIAVQDVDLEVPVISFMTANYVAREVGYAMHGWGHGDRATNEAFAPLETYGEKLDELLGDIRALGFDAVDIWGAHLSPDWATDEHVDIAVDALQQHALTVTTYATWVGPSNIERSCELALALGTPLLGGGFSGEPEALAPVLAKYDVRLGIENHPEKTPSEVLAKIERGGAHFGATVDTGWWGTQGYDAAQAIEELGEHVWHVHLKDVLAVGEPHDTCRWGEGIVPIDDCLRALERIGYAGAIAIEHEPETFDPTDDIRAMRERLA